MPDREAKTLAAWLREHPGVEVICRDRAEAYAEGATSGAPQAKQVPDRFHLLGNLAEVLQQVFAHHAALLTTPEAEFTPLPLFDPALEDAPATPAKPVVMLMPSLPHAASQARRNRRLGHYQQVRELYQQGWTISAIAQHLTMNRATVRRYAQAEVFPERKRSASKLDPFKAYLLARWNQGCRTGTLLFEEIKQQGYQGKHATVFNYLTRLRRAQGLPARSRQLQPKVLVADASAQRLTPRQATRLVLRRAEKLGDEDKALISQFSEAHPDLQEAITLAQDFALMLRERLAAHLDSWLQRASESTIKAFRNFVKSLGRDYAAVKVAFTEPWSTSPAEGHINRLKMLKRQMYGRAKLDLLEQRFLNAA